VLHRINFDAGILVTPLGSLGNLSATLMTICFDDHSFRVDAKQYISTLVKTTVFSISSTATGLILEIRWFKIADGNFLHRYNSIKIIIESSYVTGLTLALVGDFSSAWTPYEVILF
jgi:hypothetical protein